MGNGLLSWLTIASLFILLTLQSFAAEKSYTKRINKDVHRVVDVLVRI